MEITTLEVLQQAGLTKDQASLYMALLSKGSLTARAATQEAKVSRTLGYAVLKQLEEQGLVRKTENPGEVARFSPTHPAILQERIEANAKAAERAAITLKSALPDLSSLYNLVTGRPGIRFYEGLEGIKEVLNDTLSAKESIYTYADLEMIEKHIGDINRDYARTRDKLRIKKKALLLDTQENRFLLEGYHTQVTDVKLIKAEAVPFKTVMQIYDGKISYFTLGVEQLVGVIIADPHIYEMHKTLFNVLWDSPLSKSAA